MLADPGRAELVREPVSTTAGPAPDMPPQDAAPASRVVRGIVLDLAGRPVGGLRIGSLPRGPFPWTLSAAPQAQSGPDGSFELPAAGDVLVVAQGPGWITAFPGRPSQREDVELLVIVAPSISVGGIVRDASTRQPVPDASVELLFTANALSAVARPTDSQIEWPDVRTRSDAEGRFTFDSLPVIPTAKLLASCAGYLEAAEAAVPQTTTHDLELLIGTLEADSSVLRGLVMDETRTPLPEAVIRFCGLRTQTDTAGRFALEYPKLVKPCPLVVTKVGYQPFIDPELGARLWLEGNPGIYEVVLRHGELEIRGRVIDGQGQPCPKWFVSLVDPTPMIPGLLPIEPVEAGGQSSARTAQDGSFVLTGLYARAYTVLAWDPETLDNARRTGVAAGTSDLILQAARADQVGAISGVVVSRGGHRLHDVTVTSILVTRGDAGAFFHSSYEPGESTRSDEDGRFELPVIPGDEIVLHCHGDAILPQRFVLDREAVRAELRLEVAELRHFRVECVGTWVEHMCLRVLDRDDVKLEVYTFAANVMTISNLYTLDGPQSPVLAVAEDAAKIEFHLGPKLLATLLLDLVRGEVVTVRY